MNLIPCKLTETQKHIKDQKGLSQNGLTDITGVVKAVEHFINSERAQVVPERHKNTNINNGQTFHLQQQQQQQSEFLGHKGTTGEVDSLTSCCQKPVQEIFHSSPVS